MLTPQPQPSSEPRLRTLVIELSRARDSADPYGFTFEPQRYLVRGAGGRVRELTIVPILNGDEHPPPPTSEAATATASGSVDQDGHPTATTGPDTSASTTSASTTKASTAEASTAEAASEETRPAGSVQRRPKRVPFTLSLSGGRADAGCWTACDDDQACKDACGARHKELRAAITKHLPTLGACFDRSKPDTFLDPDAREGTRWSAQISVRVHADGELEALKVESQSRAPIPAQCIQEAVGELRLPPAELDYDTSVIGIMNSDDEEVRRVFGGWTP